MTTMETPSRSKDSETITTTTACGFINDNSADYKCLVDFVAWGSHVPEQCNDSTDDAVKAGLWTEDTYVDTSGGAGEIYLTTAGNNDEAVSDWTIPEFGGASVPAGACAALFVVVRHRKRKR